MTGSFKKVYLLIGILVIFLVGLGVATFYFYKKSKITPPVSSLNELDKTIEEISKVALLPNDDSPTLFSVTDPTQLTSDAFFNASLSGDEMLLYPRIGFAILYRPSTKQVINMIHFNPSSNTGEVLGNQTYATSTKK